MDSRQFVGALALILCWNAAARPQDAGSAQKLVIAVMADQPTTPISRLLTGACIEDVNHEIYGGLYSQMVFGESFQEPETLENRLKGFRILGGQWQVQQGELHFAGDRGAKVVSDLPGFTDGEVGVEVYVPDRRLTNAGLIVRVARAEVGADRFDGYEIALNAQEQSVLLGRHQQDFQRLKVAPCEVPTGQWVSLVARLNGSAIEVSVNGNTVLRYDDGRAVLPAGTIGLRQWQREARYRNLSVKASGRTQTLPFEPVSNTPLAVSGMWRPVQTGGAKGSFALATDRPFVGRQSQRITHTDGAGQVGVENQGLNRRGMHFAEGKPYEGVLWARADTATDLFVTLESRNGSEPLAEARLSLKGDDWQRLSFTLTPKATGLGRLAITLRQPGSVILGYALLQPGDWGRFKGLPVRRDVAEAMIDQGVTVLRYGGSMVNHAEYRWKNMIGPRDRRSPHRGTWYPYSSNGWGIPDFLSFCEAAGFEAIPTFCMDETPQDMADFIRYAKAPVDSEWGKRRAADGHPEPYKLRYVELGNEERVDEGYFRKFERLAEAIWATDPEVVIVVGDFDYREAIRDPFMFRGNSSGITTLAAHQKILQLAKERGREVWFDVHVWTDGPRPTSTLPGALSLIDALEKIGDGARFKVAVFELNANNHGVRRALANALAIQAIERDGRIAVVASANGLQPDGQNDNGWDQGLLFLNPSRTWLQPPGYVTQLYSRNYQPRLVPCRVTGATGTLDVNAKLSRDGKTLLLQAVNPTDRSVPAEIQLSGFAPVKNEARVTDLSGELSAKNSDLQPSTVVPHARSWAHELKGGKATYSFPPRSVTFITWE
ncbi:MAG: alpha-L-arabinofuranosidase C-terminal domain-containing protein [Gemmataceae bacterium]